MSTEPSAVPSFGVGRSAIGSSTIRHRCFDETATALREAMACHRLVLLVGASGVGKSVLVSTLAAETNEAVRDRPSEYRAAVVTAPASHRRAFSWKDFWRDVLCALDDPLPDDKVDRVATVDALARARLARLRRMTEGELLRAVSCAARDRGLRVLFVDEAVALVKAEHGRVLRDQLDVLRNLADLADFQLVLISTPRILRSLEFSGELSRRTAEVYFPRYLREGPSADMALRDFSRVFATFMRVLPEPARYRPGREQLRLLHAGSLGCVGHLADWLKRALIRAETSGVLRLEWTHFEQTVLSDMKLGHLEEEARTGEDRIIEASARTFGLSVPAAEPATVPTPAGSVSVSDGAEPARARRRSRRVGTPKPKRKRVH